MDTYGEKIGKIWIKVCIKNINETYNFINPRPIFCFLFALRSCSFMRMNLFGGTDTEMVFASIWHTQFETLNFYNSHVFTRISASQNL